MQFRLALVVSLCALAACSGKEVEGCTGYTVVATVTDPEGAPLADAVVTALPSSAPFPENEVVCPGADGVFTCTLPNGGLWKVYAEATSYEGFGEEVNLTDTCETPLSYLLARESAV